MAAAFAALEAGQPRLAARRFAACLPTLPQQAGLGLAAARLRLGDAAGTREALAGVSPDARRALLLARAGWLDADPAALSLALEARRLARAEGDSPALMAAATLLGELQLAAGEARTALRTLAEGLKAAELLGQPAEAQLLAVLARVQAQVGGPAKARRTAEKALERSLPGSPARVQALLALDRTEEAQVEAERGELAPAYLKRF